MTHNWNSYKLHQTEARYIINYVINYVLKNYIPNGSVRWTRHSLEGGGSLISLMG